MSRRRTQSLPGPRPAMPVPAAPAERPPRLFGLYRHEDVHGRSGTGLVAWGVIWPDGRVTTYWVLSPADVHQITQWQNTTEINRTHGHGVRTRIVATGPTAAVEQFDTAALRELLARYQQAVEASRGGLAHLQIALQLVDALPVLLDRHDALAAAYAAQSAELDAIRPEYEAMQEALDTIADLTPPAGRQAG